MLFADIKGFTSIAEKLRPEELVTLLDQVFSSFDNIIEKYGMEKIKTIGDAYMCACGLPVADNENAVKAVRAAIEMQEFVNNFSQSPANGNLPVFKIRIGIHTGPLVAGVVGLRKFAYDIWGDTVNLASQMEQHSEPGKINVSSFTHEKIMDQFHSSYRGKIEAKSKGEVDMYFVKEK